MQVPQLKKFLTPHILGIVLIGAGAIILIFLLLTKNNDTPSPQPVKTSNYQTIDACSVLTLNDAKNLIGSTAKKSSGTSLGASTKETAVSTCIYGQDSSKVPINETKTLKTITILISSPKTEIGKKDNKAKFTTKKPAGVQDISGIGDKAYWLPTYGLLSVLKGNYYITLSSGTATPGSHNIDDAKKLANMVLPKIPKL